MPWLTGKIGRSKRRKKSPPPTKVSTDAPAAATTTKNVQTTTKKTTGCFLQSKPISLRAKKGGPGAGPTAFHYVMFCIP